jgi:drug/metabolite transporter (DMT)-like permease
LTKLLLLVLCVLVFSTADYFAARWGDQRDGKSLAVTLLVGPFAYLLFGHLAATTSLVKMGAYVNSGIVLGTAAAGFFLLSERPNRTTWIALCLIVAGITLLGVGKVGRGAG